jgi:hypothetical protein
MILNMSNMTGQPVEQKLLNNPEHPSSFQFFVAQSCIVFWSSSLVFLPFFFLSLFELWLLITPLVTSNFPNELSTLIQDYFILLTN